MSTLAGFRALSKAERRVALHAAAWLPVFCLGVSTLGLPRFRRLLDRAARPAASARGELAPEVLAGIVSRVAGRLTIPITCLTRSIYLHWLLRRQGIASELRIGVDLSAGELLAHAWVERGGLPLGESPGVLVRYAPFEHRL